MTTLHKLNAQIVLERTELKTININNFVNSKFYKTIKSQPKVSTMIGSGRTLNGGCIDISNTSYFFKKENILFIFTASKTDTGQIKIISDIYINKRNNLFITEDSVKVGDKVSLTLLCIDIVNLKNNNNKYVDKLYHNGVYYEFNKIARRKINKETVVTIKTINIRPWSETPNY